MRLLLNFETTAPQLPSKDGGGHNVPPPRPLETAEGAAPDRVKDVMRVKNPRFLGHSDDEAFDKVKLVPLATLGFFVQVWPKNGTFTALQDIMGVKNPRFMGNSDDGELDKVELVPLATLGGFVQV